MIDKLKSRVLVAGIGGASLGTEILKCLKLSEKYEIFGCDISKLAYGHYVGGFKKTFIVDRGKYIESILDLCVNNKIDFIVPGAGETTILLNESREKIRATGTKLAINSYDVIRKHSDKKISFETLSGFNIDTPLTKSVSRADEIEYLEGLNFPLVVKPAKGSGGSNSVFLVADIDEAFLYVNHLLENGRTAVVQEYLSEKEGEYTVGVVSLPGGEIACSVALKRIFDSKLSVSAETKTGLISSGYSQGIIEDFPEIRAQAENIAHTIHSEGPINIQGRVRDGILIPFEINPRFSASCYLRALAGINEVDVFLQHLSSGLHKPPHLLHEGYYLRSFSELFVENGKIKQ